MYHEVHVGAKDSETADKIYQKQNAWVELNQTISVSGRISALTTDSTRYGVSARENYLLLR